MERAFGCQWQRATKAAKKLAVGMVLTMTGFALVMVGISNFVERHHPHGALVYVLAALPSIPIFCMMGVVGIYLRDELDEFQRGVMVRSLLWAIAGTLAMSWFTSMLRGFDAMGFLPPFTELAVFWILFGAAEVVQVVANRVKRND